MKTGKRLACLLLALLLLVPPARNGAQAALTVYFTSANDTLLDLNDETMPFWAGSTLYVADTAISGTDLGVSYSRSRDKLTVVLYQQRSVLIFDLAAGTIRDSGDKSYEGKAIVRGDVVFLPLDLIARFFGLDYTCTKISYGYLVRIRSAAAVLSDSKFIEAAAIPMEQRYDQYEKAHKDSGAVHYVPGSEDDDGSARSTAYLTVAVSGTEPAGDVLDALSKSGGFATFLFSPAQLSGADDLLRRIVVSGNSVALRVDASGGAAQTLVQIERANEALWTASNLKTRLVYLEGAADAAEKAVEQAGYCPITFALDYRETLPSASRTGSAVRTEANKRGKCIAFLGDDAAVQEMIAGVVTSLRANGCAVARLNEVAA